MLRRPFDGVDVDFSVLLGPPLAAEVQRDHVWFRNVRMAETSNGVVRVRILKHSLRFNKSRDISALLPVHQGLSNKNTWLG